MVSLWMALLCRRAQSTAHVSTAEASLEAARVYRLLNRLTRRLPDYDIGLALLFALAATNLVEAAHPLDSPERAWLARARMGAGMR